MQDGVIETEELVSFIENVISTENRLKQLKLVAGLLIVFMGVFMAATFGLTYVVADMHKDTITMVRKVVHPSERTALVSDLS